MYIGGEVDDKTLLQHVDDTILDMLEEQEQQVQNSSMLGVFIIHPACHILTLCT